MSAIEHTAVSVVEARPAPQVHRRGGLVGWVRDLGMPKTRVEDMASRTGAAPAADAEQIAALDARLRAHRRDV